MNVRDIVTKYLKENGYDGLCNEDCGCSVEDLFPCGEPNENCVPGYKGQFLSESVPVEFRGDWVIYPTKKARDAAIREAKKGGTE